VFAVALPTRSIRRLSHGIPIARLLLVADVALLARRHITRLDRAERRRLLALVRRTRGRPSALTAADRRELAMLVARLEPRLFLGLAVKRLSPVPVPKRLLYGRRSSRARRALASGLGG
jgi:hypothetical protein